MWPARRSLRIFWAAVAGTVFAAGCASHAGLPPVAQTQPGIPLRLAHDLGARAAERRVEAAIVLRFNDENGLERLVEDASDPDSPRYHHFLTPEAFDERYAPTPAQHRRVLDALRAAGFRIDRTYPDRSLIDASAPAAVAERLFSTQIDDFGEGRYGTRYANVRPVVVPDAIAPLVAAVELNSIVFAKEAALWDDGDAAQRVERIKNGGFEEKKRHWRDCGRPPISTRHPFAGKYDLLVGSLEPTSGMPNGLQAVCQRVTIPNGAVLAAHTYSITNAKKLDQGYQEVGLMSAPGKIVAVLRKNNVSRQHWEYTTWDLHAYAGQRLYVFFAVDGHKERHLYDTLFVDDVSLTGVAPTPSPSPSPTPSTSPTPSPTPTPVGRGPGKPLAGPTYGPNNGWAPRALADGFDLPVQHGYDGRGTGVAIVVQSAVLQSDLADFLAANGIKRRGALIETPVNGGPTGGDPHETMVEVEAIAALAPGAKIVAYETPDLSNLSVLDAYHAALTAKSASILNSSFGECDRSDPAFDRATEQDAVHGAALGITFVAASGDTGSACYDPSKNTNVVGANAPASNPHVLAVGGTESISGRTTATPCPCPVATPVAWDNSDANPSFPGFSGGGVSKYWTLPTYQRGVAGAPASSTHRNVPDIAYPAVDDDVRVEGIDQLVNGTSWSSAQASALLAGTVQICGKLGFANPAVYKTFARVPAKAFVDVLSGANGPYAPALQKFYTAGPGYDNVTGAGMPRGFAFATALCGKSVRLVP